MPQPQTEAGNGQAAMAHRCWQQGVAKLGQADFDAAADAFEQATRLAPGDALYWVNLANAYRKRGEIERAIEAAEQGLRADSSQLLALQLIAECHMAAHRYADAVAMFERLEAAGRRDSDAMVEHGAMLQAMGRHPEAIAKFLDASTLKPDNVQAHALLSTSLRDIGYKREAVECLKTVLALKPQDLQTLSAESYEKRHLFDWADLDADVLAMSEMLRTQPFGLARVATVFAMLSLPIEPELVLVAARGEALMAAVSKRPLPPVAPAQRQRGKIRVGYLSYDFREHPVAQLLVEVLELRDRETFELVLYSAGPDDGAAVRQRLIDTADGFVDLRGMTDEQAAQRIRDDAVDILVDLQGHTRGHRLGIMAMRAAPVQVAYLGYPGTTGADYIDYLIGDPLVTPVQLASHYSEKLAQLPLCFQPNGRWRPLPKPMTRAQAGLPDDAFVMCAFNHTYKILPEAFDAWCAVMREVPSAVLWLKETSGQMREAVHAAAAARGVAAQRICWAHGVAFDEHFSRMALADVFVDTWPYNAHTTASDALWAGLPVVTRYQNSFASRVAASVLNAAGLAELACGTTEDYTRTIMTLATQPELLRGYRELLRSRRDEMPLFDSKRYAGELGALYQRMMARWRAGQRPDHLLAEG